MAAIIFISKKDFKKEGKSLAKWAEYQLLDSTGADDDVLSRQYTHCETVDGFAVKKEIYKPVEKDSLDSDYDFDASSLDFDNLDSIGKKNSSKFSENQRKAQKRYLKSKNFMMAFGLCLSILVRTKGQANVYVILKNGNYKHFAEKMVKRMEKIMGDQVGKIVYMWTDLEESDTKKSVLTNSIPQADLDVIKEMALAINKEYAE